MKPTFAAVARVDRVDRFTPPHGGPARCDGTANPCAHIGSTLDRLYGDYVWMLCERGADLRVQDWDSSYVFVNTSREPLFAPMSLA